MRSQSSEERTITYMGNPGKESPKREYQIKRKYHKELLPIFHHPKEL
jgi:hypothetical protein